MQSMCFSAVRCNIIKEVNKKEMNEYQDTDPGNHAQSISSAIQITATRLSEIGDQLNASYADHNAQRNQFRGAQHQQPDQYADDRYTKRKKARRRAPPETFWAEFCSQAVYFLLQMIF